MKKLELIATIAQLQGLGSAAKMHLRAIKKHLRRKSYAAVNTSINPNRLTRCMSNVRSVLISASHASLMLQRAYLRDKRRDDFKGLDLEQRNLGFRVEGEGAQSTEIGRVQLALHGQTI